MLKTIFLLIALLFVSNYVRAQVNPNHYYQSFSLACEEYGKKQLSRWEYDDQNELATLIHSCRGNFDGQCIRKITSVLSTFEFDDLTEYSILARSCRGSNIECIDWISSNLSGFQFDDPSEVTRVSSACWATDMNCVKSICSLDRTRCQQLNEMTLVAQKCAAPRKK